MSALLLNPTQAATNLFAYHNLPFEEPELVLFSSLKVLPPAGLFTCIYHTFSDVDANDWHHHRCTKLLTPKSSLDICQAWKEFYHFVGDPILKHDDEILQRYLTSFLRILLCAEHNTGIEHLRPLILEFRTIMISWRKDYFFQKPESQSSPASETAKSSPVNRLSKFFRFSSGSSKKDDAEASPSPSEKRGQERRQTWSGRSFESGSSGSSVKEQEAGSSGVIGKTSTAISRMMTNRSERMEID